MMPTPVKSAALEAIPWVSHGFFTRQGGVGQGLYSSLNCGWGAKEDPADGVRENRARVAACLSLSQGEQLLTADQRHTSEAVVAENVWTPATRPVADAIVTTRPGIGLGILTADCVPVLFASSKDKIIGAAHAGWKGALGGVLESTIARMLDRGAQRQDIHAVIGPCIGPRSYEVSDDFCIPFLARDKAHAEFFKKAAVPGKLLFDLPGYAAARLQAMGIGGIHDVKRDTLAEEDVFFSYRRSSLRGEPDYGRQISAISIRE